MFKYLIKIQNHHISSRKRTCILSLLGRKFFIETPKDHNRQKQTWSSYKYHNTIKVLAAVPASSSILFVSKAYGGSISDKRITIDCGYLDRIDPNTTLMADKGSNILDECNARHIKLVVPPGKRGQKGP